MSFIPSIKLVDERMGLGALAQISHFGALKTALIRPILQGNFPGGALDTTVWAQTLVGAATNPVASGVATPTLTVASGDSVKLKSVNIATFEPGQVTAFQAEVYAGTGLANNTRRWGVMNAAETDGLFFEWLGIAFRVVARKASTDTAVVSSAFNGDPNWTPMAANDVYRIFYSSSRAVFCRDQDGNLKTIHTMTRGDFPLVNDLDLGFYFENVNTATAASGVFMRVAEASSSIFGEPATATGSSVVTDSSAAQLVKAILTGKDTSGVYQNVITNPGAALIVSDFLQEVGAGTITGYSSVRVSGRTASLTALGTFPQDVWGVTGTYTGQPTATSETVDVFSSSGSDTAAGVGARTVFIEGLDAGYALQSETITMAGAGLVTSAGTYRRVFRLRVVTAGTSVSNVGTITVRHTTTTANVFLTVPVGVNYSQSAVYTIPDSTTGRLQRFDLFLSRDAGVAGSARVRLLIRPDGETYQAIRDYELTTGGGPYSIDFTVPQLLAARTDVNVRVESVSNDSTFVMAEYEILLET